MRRDRSFYEQRFASVYRNLNERQRQAVDQIEGPVMILAGPGTGKTHLLAARIGRILLNTDAQAHNILCLTFTDAAVQNMRLRLLDFIGPDAQRVHINTFHSFCNGIIQDNLAFFGRRDLEPLTELERVDFIRQLLDELPPDHLLRRGRTDRYFYEGHLIRLFRQMKQQDWQLQHLEKAVRDYLQDLPNRPEYIYQLSRGSFRKGDLKTAKLQEQQERMERLLAAARLYEPYRQKLRRAGRYDYEDMILWVLDAFQRNEALLRRYQEQHLYVLVDEYQDTNGAQNELLRQLVAYWDNPNLCIVGDEDQSIFEFQGARLQNLLDFYRDYREHIRLVVLEDNYRSTQAILDTGGRLIRHNRLRATELLEDMQGDKALRAARPDRQASAVRPGWTTYRNRYQEAVDVAGQVEKLIRGGLPPGEIALLFARHEQARLIRSLLEKKGIPYFAKRDVDLLQNPLFGQLIQLLHYLHAELERPYSGEHLLFENLHAAFWQLDLQDLAVLAQYRAKKAPQARPRWRDMLTDAGLLRTRKLKDPARLLEVGELLAALLSDAANLSLPHLLERILNRSGLLAHLLDQPNYLWWTQAMHHFFRFVESEALRRPGFRLAHLLELLDRMQANRLPLLVRSQLPTDDAVQLLTAHSAKGLEFQQVFIPDATAAYWEPAQRRHAFQFPLPDTLTLSREEDAMEARRRLFYVALTRAKEGLHLSWSEADENGKELLPAVFVQEALDPETARVQARAVPAEAVRTAQLQHLQEQPTVRLERPKAEVLDQLLASYRLSISGLNRLLRCPLSFYYEQILHVPVPPSKSALFGTAVYRALQELSASRHIDGPELVRLFELEMERMRSQWAPPAYTQYLARGRRFLPDFFTRHLQGWAEHRYAEYRVHQTEVEGVPLSGVIDRVDLLDGQTARLVDYKTGRFRKRRLRPPDEKKPEGGSYWRQLHFYRLLLGEAPAFRGWRIPRGQLLFVEPDPGGIFHAESLDFFLENLRLMRELIRKSWDQIQEHDFFEGCGEDHCPWCNFVRRNLQVSSFAQEPIESLDDH
jgi:DNA helicase-2/ATP-dependent DNA helicase PcrA